MSKTDNARLPKIGARLLVTERDDMGEYTFLANDTEARRSVQRERKDKRVATQARVLHNKAVADLDMREQVQDALFTPAYTGPVGTRIAEWERVLLHEHTLACFAGAREIRLVHTCEYGCKVYATRECGELILHSNAYGHREDSIEVPVTIQHVVPTTRTVRKTEAELRAEIRRVRASRLRDEQEVERTAREHGFGQRMSGITGL